MHRFIFAVLVFCVLEYTSGYCCFREALSLSTCGCADYDTPCGIVICPKASSCGKAKCSNTCSNVGQCFCGVPTYTVSSICDCGVPACSCYRDTSNVCFVHDNPSPVCSCLKTASDCGCGCEDIRSFIYFPEVEYPVTVIEMNPFYYGGCWTY